MDIVEIAKLDNFGLKFAIANAKGMSYVHDDGDVIWVVPYADWKYPSFQSYRQVYCPDWPNSIVAAMELLEDLRKSFFRIEIVCSDHSSEWTFIGIYRCGHEEKIPNLEVMEDSLPMLICRAWLFVYSSSDEN